MPSAVMPSRRAIVALIEGDSEFAAANVRLGLPADEPTELERAYVLPNLPRQYAQLTQQGGKAETFSIPVRIEARIIGTDDADALEDRLEVLVARVFALVEDDRELGGACYDATCDQVEGPFTGPGTDGWFGTVTVQVAVQSVI